METVSWLGRPGSSASFSRRTMNRREKIAVNELQDFLAELNADPSPKYQIDYAGRIWKRGHRHEWAIHEEEENVRDFPGAMETR